MEKQIFEQLQEELYVEQMDNGLSVYILPKPGFNKTYATFTTKYGSIDNHFKEPGVEDFSRVPDGIAHFLEHKLFEKEDGDVFQQFSRQGAAANAFTSFTRTAYLFSSTSDVEKNLETLIDFVQEPYFSDQSVEKEKGIIGQEIMMYDDNADWRLYFGIIENLYHNHPVKIDIAGTVESIAGITKELLYQCYNTFYHPSNMLLFITGPEDPETIMKLVRDNQAKKEFTKQGEISRKFDDEPTSAAIKERSIQMHIQSPKCVVGIKAADTDLQGMEMLKQELSIGLFLECTFGKSSEYYESLFESGIIDNSFFYDYTQEYGFGFGMIGGDTREPDQLAERIKSILFEVKEGGFLTEEKLDAVRKKRIGGFLRSLNSLESIANQFTRYAFNEMELFDVVSVLEELTLADVQKAVDGLIEKDRLSVFQILPSSS
ncbi:zinc protease [Bacillus sp. FJAT-27916]|uniref:EF-P 5-aminopentanol modification-associated protein YfmH n=1 Tax=Bacillus sp. FJAT-27916 TaxID=1679169 RepID=UPI00067140EC|nr:pitrilysin family protein [Bacillus sp. FJAT-27916]KMY44947.1 zinc protease [Bacillus sp. FJAT-27916]